MEDAFVVIALFLLSSFVCVCVGVARGEEER